jgi:uncharacterized damage-inducible protein DinB
MEIFRKQYKLVQGSRAVMLDFIESEIGAHFTNPIQAFNGSSIRYMLVHTANTYIHWAANFALDKGLPYPDETMFNDMESVKMLYREADGLVAGFLDYFGDDINLPVTNKVRSGAIEVNTTPLELFTHMLTHEFHHKGQIMSMCRLLGHTPPDTDVIRY